MDVAEAVKSFYDKTPFPDYDLSRFETIEDLRKSAYPFASYLNRVIPKDKSVIDVGCGTGQLAAYLSLDRKKVYGIDFSDGSLKKARALKEKLKLDSLTLSKEDIFNLKVKEKFDYVLCNGVLHHTANPKLGFEKILELLERNGFIMIGLYNKYGRVPLKVRKFLIRTVLFNNKKVREWFIRQQITYLYDKTRFEGWYNDQYNHPHESSHTVKEVLKWFKESKVEYVNSIPTLRKFDNFSLDFENLFSKEEINEDSSHLLVQLGWIFKTSREGGYFLTTGRK